MIMILKLYKPYTPSMRHKKSLNFINLNIKKTKSLLNTLKKTGGRNNQGKITSRHKGGGLKQIYRKIDFKRNHYNIFGVVKQFEYDPNRNVNIALIYYTDGIKKYILAPENLNLNTKIISSTQFVEILPGNATLLKNIPLGTYIHNIELNSKQGGKLIRTAGGAAKILAKTNKFALIRLASKQVRLIPLNCLATIGILTNSDYHNIKKGKAGHSRWLGIRPTVRGSAMNPIDHPHGGGEGKSPVGHKNPKTPWGKIAFGKKTRKKHKLSNKFILNIS